MKPLITESFPQEAFGIIERAGIRAKLSLSFPTMCLYSRKEILVGREFLIETVPLTIIGYSISYRL
ncbi:MAG: hypothetical protein RLZZ04_1995 [Cyanobacteriota bacterium]|jgi:hypothetical protein